MPASAFQRATALVPLALLSTAVTASLVGVVPTTAVAEQTPPGTLPDGSTVPTEAIEAPASMSRPGVVAPGSGGDIDRAVATASAQGIPAAALSAYQRAQTVINAADKTCNIDWQLIAAIGRVESDHGRVNGNVLDDQGLATPGIYGIPLDGSNNTAVIRDTDAGQYDDDATWDRAVGPMQFIPSTWSVVGVDGDNDGKRNPQDIDDAALASAVYLCSGADDLSSDAGRREAVFRYNQSQDYVDLVLSFMAAYMDGDFTSVPNGTSSSGYLSPSPDPVRPVSAGTSGSKAGSGNGGNGGGSGSTGGSTGGSGGSTGGSGGSGGGSGGDSGDDGSTVDTPDAPGGGGGGTGDVVEDTKKAVEDTGKKVEDTVKDPGGAVKDTLTQAEALAKCAAKGVVDNPLTGVDELANCVDGLIGG